jgi:hypothetical protein
MVVNKHIPLPLNSHYLFQTYKLHSIAIKSINFFELEENPPRALKPKE